MKTQHYMRRAAGWILTLVMIYLVFISALGLMQKKLMYFPNPARFSPSEWALKELEPFDVIAKEGFTVTSWYRPAVARDKFTIVFFQGNWGYPGYRNYKVRPWLDAGYGVLMVGYRGFGNPGSPSEDGLYSDARMAVEELRHRGIREQGMIFYGESLGTGVATQMATEYKIAALILESPYTSVPDVGADRYPLVPVHWLLHDQYDSLDKIKDVHAPLLLLHGDADQVVPVKFGKQLFAAANEPKKAEFIPDAGHNNVYSLRVQQIIMSFIADLPTDALLERGGERAPANPKPQGEDPNE